MHYELIVWSALGTHCHKILLEIRSTPGRTDMYMDNKILATVTLAQIKTMWYDCSGPKPITHRDQDKASPLNTSLYNCHKAKGSSHSSLWSCCRREERYHARRTVGQISCGNSYVPFGVYSLKLVFYESQERKKKKEVHNTMSTEVLFLVPVPAPLSPLLFHRQRQSTFLNPTLSSAPK